jgi:hypothetical protein
MLDPKRPQMDARALWIVVINEILRMKYVSPLH